MRTMLSRSGILGALMFVAGCGGEPGSGSGGSHTSKAQHSDSSAGVPSEQLTRPEPRNRVSPKISTPMERGVKPPLASTARAKAQPKDVDSAKGKIAIARPPLDSRQGSSERAPVRSEHQGAGFKTAGGDKVGTPATSRPSASAASQRKGPGPKRGTAQTQQSGRPSFDFDRARRLIWSGQNEAGYALLNPALKRRDPAEIHLFGKAHFGGYGVPVNPRKAYDCYVRPARLAMSRPLLHSRLRI